MLRNKYVFIGVCFSVVFLLFMGMNFTVVKYNEGVLVDNFHSNVVFIQSSELTTDQLNDRYQILRLTYIDGELVDYPFYYPTSLVFNYEKYDENKVNRDSVSSFVFKVYENGNTTIVYKKSVYTGTMTSNSLFNTSLIVFIIVMTIIVSVYLKIFSERKIHYQTLKDILNPQDFEEEFVLENSYKQIDKVVYMNTLYIELLSLGRRAMILLNQDKKIIFFNERGDYYLNGLGNYPDVFRFSFLDEVFLTVLRDDYADGEELIGENTVTYTSYKKTINNEDFIVLYLTDITDNVRFKYNQITFFNQASHELRTPLTSILGYIELMNLCDLDKETKDNTLKSCLEECKKMESLITTVISISKRFKKDDLYVKTNMTKLVHKYIDRHKGFYKVKLNLNVKPNAMFICNYLKVELILNNIVKNAYQHNIINGYIDMELTEHNRNIELTIRNSTKELIEEEVAQIFEPFFKCNYDSDSKIVGAGLGLCLVEAVCKSYNYKIDYSYKDKVFEIKILFCNPDLD